MDIMMKKVVVYSQLENEVLKIFKKEHEDYLFYAKECEKESASPEEFIGEIIKVAKMQRKPSDYISEIQKYYNCNEDYAILLYKFTDAYLLMKK